MGWYCGAGVFGLMGVNRSLPALHCQPFLRIIIIIITRDVMRRTISIPITHFIETRLQKKNWHKNKNTDGLVNRLASNLVTLNQAHRVAWLIGQEHLSLREVRPLLSDH